MKNFRIEFRWALLITIFKVFWLYFEKYLGYHDEFSSKQISFHLLIYIPIALLYFFEMYNKREALYEGFISWKQAAVSGGVLSFLLAIMAPLVQYLLVEYISPDFFQNVIQHAIEERGMTKKSAEQLFSLRFFMIQSVFTSLAFGMGISALMALFVKKRPAHE